MKKFFEYLSKVVEERKSISARSTKPNYNSAATSPALIINGDPNEKKSYVSDVELKSDLESNQSVPVSEVAREENNSDEAVHEDLTGYSEIAAAEIPANEENNTAAIISRRLHYYFDNFDQEKREKLYEEVIGTLPSIPHHPRDFDFYRLAQRGIIQFLPKYPGTFSSRLGLHSAFAIDKLSWGVSLAIQDIWPAAFAGLLAHDLIQYARLSGERYGNTIWNILLGNIFGQHALGGMPNEHNLTNHLGSYILSSDYAYWLGTVSVLGLPLATAIASYLLHLCLHYPSLPDFSILENQHLAAHNRLGELYKFIYPMRRELTRAEFNLLWNGALTSEQNAQHIAQAMMDGVNRQADSAVLTRFQAMRVLANVANAYSEEREHGKMALETLKKLAEGSSTETSEELRKSAKAKSTRAFSAVTSLYANYLLWRIGKNDKRRFNWTFTPLSSAFSSYATYANLRLVDIVMQKMIDIVAYLLQRNRCEEAEKVCYYAKEIAAYVCQFCPWDFVNWNDRNSVQGCFDAVMRNPNLSPAKVLEYVATLHKHQGVTDVYLPASFDNFTQAEQQQFYSMVERMVGPQGVNSFNASLPNPRPLPPRKEQVDAMAAFTKVTSPIIVDVTKNNLGNGLATVIHSLEGNGRTETLILDGNPFSGNDSVVVANAMLQMPLHKLSLSDVDATDDDASRIAANLKDSPVSYLVVSNNQIGDRGLKALATGIVNNTQIQTFDISGNQAISYQGLQPLSEAMQTSGIETFRMSNTGAGDNEMYALASFFPESNFKTIDVSQNPQVTDNGIVYVFQQCANTTITSVNAAGIPTTDQGMQAIKEILLNPAVAVKEVDFSDTSTYGIAGFSALVGNNTQLTSVRAANNNNLESQAGCIVANALEQPGNTLQHIDLSNTGMADDCAVPLFQASVDAEVKTIIVANNPITPASTTALVNLVQAGKVETLSLSGTQINASTTQAVAPVLHGSTVKNLDLSYTSQGDLGVDALAENLITMNPASPTIPITNPTLSVDQLRWLHRHGQQNTNVSQLNLFNTGASAESDAILCRRVLPHTNTIITPDPCQVSQSSSGNRASSFFDGSWRATLTKVVTGSAVAATTAATADGLTHQNNSASFSPVQASRELPDWRLCLLLAGTSLLVVIVLCRFVYKQACEFEARNNRKDEENLRPGM